MRIKLPSLGLVLFFLTFTGLATASHANPRVLNEAFALTNARILHGAQMAYSVNLGNDEFTSDLQVLRQAGLIDPVLSTGYKHFYNFTLTAQPSTTASRSNFTVSAVPSRYGSRARVSFFVDLLGRIHGADKNGEPATTSDPIVGDCTTDTAFDNQRCTIYALHRLKTAQKRYLAVHGRYGTGSELVNAGEIDPALGSLISRGYTFTMYTQAPSPPFFSATFKIYGFPFTYGQSGRMNYLIDNSGILRGTERQTPLVNEADPTINVY